MGVGIFSKRAGASGIILPLHLGFLLIGIVNTMLGPVLPLLSARWQLDDSSAGVLFFAQAAGAMLGSALSGVLIRWLGRATLLLVGFGLMSAGTGFLCLGQWGTGIVSISVTGLALGLTIPTINLLVSELNPTRRAAALNLLNLAWGLGAVSGPLLLPALSRVAGLAAALLFLAAWVGLVAVLIARLKAIVPDPVPTGTTAALVSAVRLWVSPYLLLTGALVFVNIGTEAAVGGWIASYVQRIDPASQLSWALAPSLFWAGLLAGRAAAPLVLRRVREVQMVLLGMLVAVCGLLVVLLSTRVASMLIGVGLAGLGLAPAFPTTVALFTQRLGTDAPRLTGILFLTAGLGAAVFPWVVGLASTRWGDLRAGLVVPLVGGLAMIVLHAAIMYVLRSEGRRSLVHLGD